MEEGRFSQFYEHDIVILRITNHECIGIQEFTNIFFQFSRILEQHFFFSRVTKDIGFTFFKILTNSRKKKPIPAFTNAAGLHLHNHLST